MYDIIGDIHGHAMELHRLLEKLGYQQSTGVYSHPSRKVLFIGDFIDRGPQILETLQTVRRMCDAGNALAVMGNHEFNALAYHTPNPAKPGKYLRDHNTKNELQHSATLSQLNNDALKDSLDWFRTLPMWLDLGGLRVVHACWDVAQMEIILAAKERLGGVTTEFMAEATDQNTRLFAAVEDVLKARKLICLLGISSSTRTVMNENESVQSGSSRRMVWITENTVCRRIRRSLSNRSQTPSWSQLRLMTVRNRLSSLATTG
jgi:hypothetical protein